MRGLSNRIVRRLREIRPARPRPPVNRRRVYGFAVVGVATLSLLALCADRSRLALGFAVAVVLAVLWVAWTAHRALVTTGLALVWWFITAPHVGLLAAGGNGPAQVSFAMSPAIATVGALGAVAGLVAVLSRTPRPALTVMLAWATNALVVWAASYLLPTNAWAVGYVVTIAVLAWRAGFRWRGRNRGCPPGVNPELHALLAAVPGGHVGAVAGRANRTVTVLAAPSGVYSVTPLLRPGTVATTPRGSRLLIDGRPLPKVSTAVRASRLTRNRLRTPVQPVLAVLTAGFADGLARATTDGATDVLVIRGDLLAGRLAHGPPVLTGNQLRRLARRIGAAAPPPEESS
ncbi:hypothetical protein Vau01_088170 [Virgisporangium aurantiacum]|uniref:Uncharacterized protein n=2 Tax=Virgisporangium aurantiacum TaxID=175570 RepID=A0A8J4E4J5_9ACTN|nr:hypothetical protein Vau01_088170 [Virgisporangium aurantiacum]